MSRNHIWQLEGMWAENPTTIQIRISREAEILAHGSGFLECLSAVNITNEAKGSDERDSPRYLQQVGYSNHTIDHSNSQENAFEFSVCAKYVQGQLSLVVVLSQILNHISFQFQKS